MEAKVFFKSLGLNFLSFIKIDDLPFLISSFVSIPDNDLSTFSIFATMDIKHLVAFDVLEVLCFIDEDLEPSRVGAPDLHVVGSSGILNVP